MRKPHCIGRCDDDGNYGEVTKGCRATGITSKRRLTAKLMTGARVHNRLFFTALLVHIIAVIKKRIVEIRISQAGTCALHVRLSGWRQNMNSVREAKLTDREKVVEKLQAIDAYFRESFNAMDGTLACEQFREWSNAAEDAIALLKAQEPVEPVFERQFMSCIKIYDCGKCGTSLGAKGIAKYCMECGQAVKWE